MFIGPGGGSILAARKFRVGLDFDVTMQIKPRNVSGILLAIQGRRDFLILQMIDGTLTFTVDNGRGPITAFFKPPDSTFQFCDGRWHDIHGTMCMWRGAGGSFAAHAAAAAAIIL